MIIKSKILLLAYILVTTAIAICGQQLQQQHERAQDVATTIATPMILSELQTKAAKLEADRMQQQQKYSKAKLALLAGSNTTTTITTILPQQIPQHAVHREFASTTTPATSISTILTASIGRNPKLSTTATAAQNTQLMSHQRSLNNDVNNRQDSNNDHDRLRLKSHENLSSAAAAAASRQQRIAIGDKQLPHELVIVVSAAPTVSQSSHRDQFAKIATTINVVVAKPNAELDAAFEANYVKVNVDDAKQDRQQLAALPDNIVNMPSSKNNINFIKVLPSKFKVIKVDNIEPSSMMLLAAQKQSAATYKPTIKINVVEKLKPSSAIKVLNDKQNIEKEQEANEAGKAFTTMQMNDKKTTEGSGQQFMNTKALAEGGEKRLLSMKKAKKMAVIKDNVQTEVDVDRSTKGSIKGSQMEKVTTADSRKFRANNETSNKMAKISGEVNDKENTVKLEVASREDEQIPKEAVRKEWSVSAEDVTNTSLEATENKWGMFEEKVRKTLQEAAETEWRISKKYNEETIKEAAKKERIQFEEKATKTAAIFEEEDSKTSKKAAGGDEEKETHHEESEEMWRRLSKEDKQPLTGKAQAPKENSVEEWMSLTNEDNRTPAATVEEQWSMLKEELNKSPTETSRIEWKKLVEDDMKTEKEAVEDEWRKFKKKVKIAPTENDDEKRRKFKKKNIASQTKNSEEERSVFKEEDTEKAADKEWRMLSETFEDVSRMLRKEDTKTSEVVAERVGGNPKEDDMKTPSKADNMKWRTIQAENDTKISNQTKTTSSRMLKEDYIKKPKASIKEDSQKLPVRDSKTIREDSQSLPKKDSKKSAKAAIREDSTKKVEKDVTEEWKSFPKEDSTETPTETDYKYYADTSISHKHSIPFLDLTVREESMKSSIEYSKKSSKAAVREDSHGLSKMDFTKNFGVKKKDFITPRETNGREDWKNLSKEDPTTTSAKAACKEYTETSLKTNYKDDSTQTLESIVREESQNLPLEESIKISKEAVLGKLKNRLLDDVTEDSKKYEAYVASNLSQLEEKPKVLKTHRRLESSIPIHEELNLMAMKAKRSNGGLRYISENFHIESNEASESLESNNHNNAKENSAEIETENNFESVFESDIKSGVKSVVESVAESGVKSVTDRSVKSETNAELEDSSREQKQSTIEGNTTRDTKNESESENVIESDNYNESTTRHNIERTNNTEKSNVYVKNIDANSETVQEKSLNDEFMSQTSVGADEKSSKTDINRRFTKANIENGSENLMKTTGETKNISNDNNFKTITSNTNQAERETVNYIENGNERNNIIDTVDTNTEGVFYTTIDDKTESSSFKEEIVDAKGRHDSTIEKPTQSDASREIKNVIDSIYSKTEGAIHTTIDGITKIIKTNEKVVDGRHLIEKTTQNNASPEMRINTKSGYDNKSINDSVSNSIEETAIHKKNTKSCKVDGNCNTLNSSIDAGPEQILRNDGKNDTTAFTEHKKNTRSNLVSNTNVMKSISESNSINGATYTTTEAVIDNSNEHSFVLNDYNSKTTDNDVYSYGESFTYNGVIDTTEPIIEIVSENFITSDTSSASYASNVLQNKSNENETHDRSNEINNESKRDTTNAKTISKSEFRDIKNAASDSLASKTALTAAESNTKLINNNNSAEITGGVIDTTKLAIKMNGENASQDTTVGNANDKEENTSGVNDTTKFSMGKTVAHTNFSKINATSIIVNNKTYIRNENFTKVLPDTAIETNSNNNNESLNLSNADNTNEAHSNAVDFQKQQQQKNFVALKKFSAIKQLIQKLDSAKIGEKNLAVDALEQHSINAKIKTTPATLALENHTTVTAEGQTSNFNDQWQQQQEKLPTEQRTTKAAYIVGSKNNEDTAAATLAAAIKITNRQQFNESALFSADSQNNSNATTKQITAENLTATKATTTVPTTITTKTVSVLPKISNGGRRIKMRDASRDSASRAATTTTITSTAAATASTTSLVNTKEQQLVPLKSVAGSNHTTPTAILHTLLSLGIVPTTKATVAATIAAATGSTTLDYFNYVNSSSKNNNNHSNNIAHIMTSSLTPNPIALSNFLLSATTTTTVGATTIAAASNTSPAWPVKHASVMEGDVILGGLMMVHSREDSITCGPIMPQGGIQALEAMLYTLDQVNKQQLLPNITLGAHILDDCDKDTYGLEMAVDFIKGM